MGGRAALILAGGNARRFQTKNEQWQDKALALINGKPMLVRALESVENIVDEIALCVSDIERGEEYIKLLERNSTSQIKIVVDEKSGISGPTVAIMSGLKQVNADYCLTVPSDMPFLQPRVADYLFQQAEGRDVVTPMWPNGRLETLLNVLQRKKGLEITQTLCTLKRPRSDDIQRGAGKILLASTVAEIKTIDPHLSSFININSKDDLRRLRSRTTNGSVQQNLNLNFEAISTSNHTCLSEAAETQTKNMLAQAAETFKECAQTLERHGSRFWAAVSWENRGESLLALSRQQETSTIADELDSEGKEAFAQAANRYRLEAEMYLGNRCTLLAERAFADKAWCESWAMGKHSHARRYPPKIT